MKYAKIPMKIAMISQPMAGKSEEEIKAVREAAEMHLKALGYVVIDSLCKTNILVKNEALYNLARSIAVMSICDTVYFCDGWRDARGCTIEHSAALLYGLEMLHEEDFTNNPNEQIK